MLLINIISVSRQRFFKIFRCLVFEFWNMSFLRAGILNDHPDLMSVKITLLARKKGL